MGNFMHESYLSSSYTGIDMYIVLNFIYIYYCKKTFGAHWDIQIAIDYEIKFKIYFISSYWLNLFEFIVGYVYMINL